MLLKADARYLPLTDQSVQCVITSPPYWGLRDYGIPGQLGLESTPEEYTENMLVVCREIWRVLRNDGTFWLNLGDSYATGGGAVGHAPGGGDQGDRFIRMGHINTQPNRMKIPGLKSKDLVGIPWRIAFALQADGWYLRSDIIWAKPNPMPESVRDRPTRAHEYLFLLTKQPRYYYDADAIREPNLDISLARAKRNRFGGKYKDQPDRYVGGITKGKNYGVNGSPSKICNPQGRNKRSVWTIPTQPTPEAHFATFPEKLVEPCVLAGSRPGDVVFDPFVGSGTTARVAKRLQRVGVGSDISYQEIAQRRTKDLQFEMFA